jgi:hypothetical protein
MDQSLELGPKRLLGVSNRVILVTQRTSFSERAAAPQVCKRSSRSLAPEEGR